MLYYSEFGEQLPADKIDLNKGYLVDRETVYHEAETHQASKELPGGLVLTWVEADKSAYTEVVSQTYILYADHPTREDEIEAALAELAGMAADNAARLDEQEAALVDVAAVAAGEEK